MVDSIGQKAPVPTERRIAPMGAAAATTKLAPVTTEQPKAEAKAASPTAALAASMASEAPVDTDRVDRIRKAIADGKFPITPATIADRMLALKMDWTGNDQA